MIAPSPLTILVISNLYPPDYLGGYELRCQLAVDGLRQRGHTVHVLTSDYRSPERQAVPEVEQAGDRLTIYRWLAFTFLAPYQTWRPPRRWFRHLRDLYRVRRLVQQLQPDVVFAWNLGALAEVLPSEITSWGIPYSFAFDDDWVFASTQIMQDWFEFFRQVAQPRALVYQRLQTGMAQRLPSPKAVARNLAWLLQWPASSYLAGKYLLAQLRQNPGDTAWRYLLWAIACPLRLPDQPFTWTASADWRYSSFVSDFRKQQYIQQGVPAEAARVIYGSIETQRFQSPTPADTLRFLYLSRISDHKGVRDVLDAFIQLTQRLTLPLRLTIAGEATEWDADCVAYLHQRIQTEGLGDRIQLIGKIPYTQVPQVYQAHDIFVFASRIPEGFPFTILEAMASGLALISTATGGNRELLQPGVNCLQFEPMDVPQLAAHMETLATNPGLRRQIAANGQAVGQQLTVDRMVDALEQSLLEAAQSAVGRDGGL